MVGRRAANRMVRQASLKRGMMAADIGLKSSRGMEDDCKHGDNTAATPAPRLSAPPGDGSTGA